jgi:acetyl-CoA synthetase
MDGQENGHHQDVYPPAPGPWHIQGEQAYRELYKQSLENPDAFWEQQAEGLHWHKKWQQPVCR